MATRTIILIRHGQYSAAKDDSPEALTPLGKQQAKYAGKRLLDYPKIDKFIVSTMPRALETCEILTRHCSYRGIIERTDLLRECVPGFPKKLRKKYGFTDTARLHRDQRTLDKAFKKYFTIPKQDSVLVLVCHGNVIRYLIAKFLEVDTLTWRQMDITQCGISVVQIRNKGDHKKMLISHNDVGHIPAAKRTFF